MRGLIVHHNVAWNGEGNSRYGIEVKGDRNKIYNNTCLPYGVAGMVLPSRPEPYKPWFKKQWPLLEKQNENSETINNCAAGLVDFRMRPAPGKTLNNYTGREPMLVDAENFDFRPRKGSPLIDAGKVIAGYTDGYKGKAPDIGAYEYGGERWVPGYRNMLWVLPGVKKPALGDKKQVRVLLAMPTLEPLRITVESMVKSQRVSPSVLSFEPDNWMKPQVVTLQTDMRDNPGNEKPALLKFSVKNVGVDLVVDISKLDPLRGAKVAFRTIR